MTLTASLIAALGLPVPCDPEHLPETGTPQLLLSCLNSEWAGGGSQDFPLHTQTWKRAGPQLGPLEVGTMKISRILITCPENLCLLVAYQMPWGNTLPNDLILTPIAL